MKIINKQTLGLILLITSLFLNGCTVTPQKEPDIEYTVDLNDFVNVNELIKNIAPSSLNNNEINGLIQMREEEKLARDVYQTLYKKWNINTFNNIAQSEQTHTDAIKILLDRYNIQDPVTSDNIGNFTSEEITNLYQSLIKKGETSLLDALIVGATIEDLDIKDLNKLTAETDNADIITTYNNLNKGSRNHLRAYIKQISSYDYVYTPQYISQTEYDNIISTDQERGKTR